MAQAPCHKNRLAEENFEIMIRDSSLNCRGGQNRFDLVISWVNVSDPIWQKSAAKSGCDVQEYLAGTGDVDVFQVRVAIYRIAKNSDKSDNYTN